MNYVNKYHNLIINRNNIITENFWEYDLSRYRPPKIIEELKFVTGSVGAIELLKMHFKNIYIVVYQPEEDKADNIAINKLVAQTLKIPFNNIFLSTNKGSFHYKPNPGLILKIINSNNLDPEKTLIIGDHCEDQYAARRAGIDFLKIEKNEDYYPNNVPDLRTFAELFIKTEHYINIC